LAERTLIQKRGLVAHVAERGKGGVADAIRRLRNACTHPTGEEGGFPLLEEEDWWRVIEDVHSLMKDMAVAAGK
jgi:hypothetical protein